MEVSQTGPRSRKVAIRLFADDGLAAFTVQCHGNKTFVAIRLFADDGLAVCLPGISSLTALLSQSAFSQMMVQQTDYNPFAIYQDVVSQSAFSQMMVQQEINGDFLVFSQESQSAFSQMMVQQELASPTKPEEGLSQSAFSQMMVQQPKPDKPEKITGVAICLFADDGLAGHKSNQQSELQKFRSKNSSQF